MRRWVSSVLPDCPARDDVALVATELGTNALRHTASGNGGKFLVTVVCSGTAVLVGVADSGAPEGPRFVTDLDAEHGRGLLVVRGLASRMGVRGDYRGRVIWAEIPWPGEVGGVFSGDPAVSRSMTRARFAWRKIARRSS